VDGGVGNNLREARARRKLSLQEVEEVTKIRSRYLQAIEDEDWDQLPSETYARAFIRTYAALLGLDGDLLAEEQRRAKGAARPGEHLPRVPPAPRPVTRNRRRRRPPPRLVALVASLAIAAALLAIGLLTGGGSDEAGNKPHGGPPQPHVGEAVPVR
jgi:cytoskeleton protein RodZ